MQSRQWGGLLTCFIDQQLTLEEAIQRKKREWEMLESINLDNVEATAD